MIRSSSIHRMSFPAASGHAVVAAGVLPLAAHTALAVTTWARQSWHIWLGYLMGILMDSPKRKWWFANGSKVFHVLRQSHVSAAVKSWLGDDHTTIKTCKWDGHQLQIPTASTWAKRVRNQRGSRWCWPSSFPLPTWYHTYNRRCGFSS